MSVPFTSMLDAVKFVANEDVKAYEELIAFEELTAYEEDTACDAIPSKDPVNTPTKDPVKDPVLYELENDAKLEVSK